MKIQDIFAQKQESVMKDLQKLESFVKRGEDFGIKTDEALKSKLTNAIKSTQNARLKVALVGGYSEGKTNIASAWLEKLDVNMKITSEESTDEIFTYIVDDKIELIDTPGLFGFKEKNGQSYKDKTRKYISEANLLLYVLNPSNPIKDSHKDEIKWLFRDLNLLPRSIFVISKFDEIADLEDEADFERNLAIKKEQVIKSLDEAINLSNDERQNLSIVAVSANPFGKGMDFWLKNLAEFKSLSHIESLQNATQNKITQNGGFDSIMIETKKSIIHDVLHKQLPLIKRENIDIQKDLSRLDESSSQISKDLARLDSKIQDAKIHLKDFAVKYFSDLSAQAQGTSLETIDEFFTREIGDKGININTRIENEFASQTASIQLELNSSITKFNSEMSDFSKVTSVMGKQGISFLQKSGIINATNIKLARDVVSKITGLGLKFKPWEAVKLASKANVFLSFAGLALEAWDSYKKMEKEEKFNKSKRDMISNFDKQKEEIINLINSDDFEQRYFPNYKPLRESLALIEQAIQNTRDKQGELLAWEKDGEMIEAEIIE